MAISKLLGQPSHQHDIHCLFSELIAMFEKDRHFLCRLLMIKKLMFSSNKLLVVNYINSVAVTHMVKLPQQPCLEFLQDP